MSKTSILRAFVVCLFSLLCSVGYGQDTASTAPSKVEMHTYLASNRDTTAMKYAEKLGELYFSERVIDSSLYYRSQSARLAKANGEKAFMLKMYTELVKMYGYFVVPGDVDSLNFYADMTLNLLQKESTEEAKRQTIQIYSSLADKVFYSQNDAEQAFKYYQKALDIAAEIEDAQRYLFISYRINALYKLDSSFDEIIAQVEDTFQKIKNFKGEKASTYYILLLKKIKASAMGYNNPTANQKAEILDTFHEMIAWSRANDKGDEEMHTITNLLIHLYDELGRDSTLIYTNRAYELLQKYPNNYNSLIVLATHGRVLLKHEQYAQAKPIFEEAVEVYEKNGGAYDLYATLMYDLTKSNIITGNKTAAETYFERYVEAKDSLSTLKKDNSLEKIEAVYALEKSEAENKNLQLQNQLIQSRSNYLLIIGGLLFAFLTAGVYFFLKLRKNKKELEKTNDSKNQLFAILAHDLKGPSASFNNLTQKVSFLLRKNQPERLMELADYFEKTGNQINYVLSNLLDWALSQKDEITHEPQPLQVRNEINKIVQNLDYLTKEKNIAIENNVNTNVIVNFDKNAFNIVMRNLLHNAIKYSHEDSKIWVESDNQKQQLLIRDQGIGMDSTLIEKIIAESRVESRTGTNQEKGNGIGMSTCVKLIRKNGGDIKIESKKNSGTKVILAYP